MTSIRQARFWSYFISEPWMWLSHCFFQPTDFSQKTETMSLKKRLVTILRISFVVFLLSYPIALFFRTLLCILNVNFYPDYFVRGFSLLDPGALAFYFDGTWPPILSCLIAGLFGALFSLRLGIAAAFGVSLATSINTSNADYTTVGVIFGLGLGLAIGPSFNTIRVIKKEGLANVTLGSLIGVLIGLTIGISVGTVGGFWGGVAVPLIGGKALRDSDSILGSVAGLVVGGIGSCLIFSLLSVPVRTLFRSKKETIDLSIRIGTAVAGALGVAVGTTNGDLGLETGSTGFMGGISAGITQGMTVGSAFLILYLLSYYRLPLYPISALSMVRANYDSSRNPGRVFAYLQQSALHFDECVFLPLPFLTRMLRTATKQNLRATLQEVEYIVLERPQQRRAAQAVAYEIALDNLSDRQLLADIERVYLELPSLLSSHVLGLNSSIAKLFSCLEDASREAASYSRHSRVMNSKRDSYDALQRMLRCLSTINPQTAFREPSLNRKLASLVERWQSLAKQVQDTLSIDMNTSSLIIDPYTVGPTLLPIDGMPNPVFVGRHDIVKKLNRVLQRIPHPTFCLTGERRMGKSSILKQLPVLLGSNYLPLFWDLHNPALHSSIAAFFAGLSETIVKHLGTRQILTSRLARSHLEQVQKENEIAVYTEFDRWLKGVEEVLERHDRILLLMFDEFEYLEVFRQRGMLDLDLLLSWFRSISQSHKQIVLLFCGVKTVHDMGPNWTSNFVNVERIKVSFLDPADARDLMNRPVSAHSTQDVFDEEVTKEMIRVSRCHPFLLQALCSRVVDTLNETSREQARVQDVATAIDEIFESWGEYFWDQWQRSSEVQQRCLLMLCNLEQASGAHIVKQSKLSPSMVYQALEQLKERDLVRKEQQIYQFAMPIFAKWVTEHSNLLQ